MSHDILAGLLPNGNPLAPFDAAAARRTAAIPAEGPGSDARVVLENPADEAVSEATAATDGIGLRSPPDRSSSPGGFPAPLVQPSPVASRRRRSFAGPILAAFALLLFAAIGICLYLLTSGLGISQHGRVIATAPKAAVEKTGTSETAAVIIEPPEDTLPQEDPPAEPARDDQLSGVQATSPSSAEPPEPEPQTGPPETLPSDGLPVDDERADTMEPELAAEPDTASADQRQGGPQWDHVYERLRSGRFSEMTPVTLAAIQASKTREQRTKANRLHRLAELAEYYDEGIRRGAAGLGTAEVFELVPGVSVIVVESTQDEFTLKVEGRVKTFSLDSMPLVLAHRLANFALPADDPVTEAGRGAYQALWPQATDAHRRQSFQWWRNLEGSAAEIGVSELETTVRELFGMPIE